MTIIPISTIMSVLLVALVLVLVLLVVVAAAVMMITTTRIMTITAIISVLRYSQYEPVRLPATSRNKCMLQTVILHAPVINLCACQRRMLISMPARPEWAIMVPNGRWVGERSLQARDHSHRVPLPYPNTPCSFLFGC